jgi:hypothetical protein
MQAADYSFVIGSWLSSYRESDFARPIRSSIYFDSLARLIKGIIPRCFGVVAVAPSDESNILGWSAWTGPLLHYLYVKEVYRRNGLGMILLGNAPDKLFCTHITHAGRCLVEKTGRKVYYNPYQFMETP